MQWTGNSSGSLWTVLGLSSSVAHHYVSLSSQQSFATLGSALSVVAINLLFTLLDIDDSAKGIQAEDNAFLMCDNIARESWIELLPPLHTELA